MGFEKSFELELHAMACTGILQVCASHLQIKRDNYRQIQPFWSMTCIGVKYSNKTTAGEPMRIEKFVIKFKAVVSQAALSGGGGERGGIDRIQLETFNKILWTVHA